MRAVIAVVLVVGLGLSWLVAWFLPRSRSC